MSEAIPPHDATGIETKREQTWQEWYQDAVEKRGKNVVDVPLENDEWHAVKDEDGNVIEMVHENALFFRVIGKDAGFKLPFIEPVVDPEDPKRRQGIIALFVDKDTGDMLLEAQFETGSKAPKGVSIRPTIQASYSNIRRNGYPFSEKFVANNIPEFSERFSVLGGMVKNEQIDPGRIGNYNLYGLLPVDRNEIDLSEKPFHRWVTQKELEEIRSRQNEFSNESPLLTNQFTVVNEMRLEWMMNKTN